MVGAHCSLRIYAPKPYIHLNFTDLRGQSAFFILITINRFLKAGLKCNLKDLNQISVKTVGKEKKGDFPLSSNNLT